MDTLNVVPSHQLTSASILILHDCLARELERLDLSVPGRDAVTASLPCRLSTELLDMQGSLQMMAGAPEGSAAAAAAAAGPVSTFVVDVERAGAELSALEQDLVCEAANDARGVSELAERLGMVERNITEPQALLVGETDRCAALQEAILLKVQVIQADLKLSALGGDDTHDLQPWVADTPAALVAVTSRIAEEEERQLRQIEEVRAAGCVVRSGKAVVVVALLLP